jgi:hypothetical protein
LGENKRSVPAREVGRSSDIEGSRASNIDVTEADIDAERMRLNWYVPPEG